MRRTEGFVSFILTIQPVINEFMGHSRSILGGLSEKMRAVLRKSSWSPSQI